MGFYEISKSSKTYFSTNFDQVCDKIPCVEMPDFLGTFTV